jgi:hypothetical protein
LVRPVANDGAAVVGNGALEVDRVGAVNSLKLNPVVVNGAIQTEESCIVRAAAFNKVVCNCKLVQK